MVENIGEALPWATLMLILPCFFQEKKEKERLEKKEQMEKEKQEKIQQKEEEKKKRLEQLRWVTRITVTYYIYYTQCRTE